MYKEFGIREDVIELSKKIEKDLEEFKSSI